MAVNYQYNKETHELFAPRTRKYIPHSGGLGKFYFDRLQLLASKTDRIAQIDATSGATQTFKQLLESATKLAQYLREFGIQPGDNITLCSYNHKNAGVVLVAAQFTGAVLSSTDPSLSLEDTKYLLNLVKPKIVFVSDGSEHLIQTSITANQLRSKIISATCSSHNEYGTIEEILGATAIDENFQPHYETDLTKTCSIVFSSGTSGMPKGINLNHHYFLSALPAIQIENSESVICNYPSMYWISNVVLMALSVSTGSARLLCKTFDKSTHWELMAKYKVTFSVMSNCYFVEASKYLTDNIDLPNLKHVMVSGGLVPEKCIATYSKMLPNALVGCSYALTEASLVTCFQAGDKFASNGKPSPLDQTIKVVDPSTQQNLPLNQIGEIRVKQPYQMSGYHSMDSSAAWDAQGFLKTGDLGYLDDEYNLFIVDRIKEMFKYRSWHVVPAKIENLLNTHPDVLHAIVIGKPTHDEDENHAMAIVCLNSGARVTAEELIALVNHKMDYINQLRAGVKIVDKSAIRFTPTGKINRYQLKEFIFGTRANH